MTEILVPRTLYLTHLLNFSLRSSLSASPAGSPVAASLFVSTTVSSVLVQSRVCAFPMMRSPVVMVTRCASRGYIWSRDVHCERWMYCCGGARRDAPRSRNRARLSYPVRRYRIFLPRHETPRSALGVTFAVLALGRRSGVSQCTRRPPTGRTCALRASPHDLIPPDVFSETQ